MWFGLKFPITAAIQTGGNFKSTTLGAEPREPFAEILCVSVELVGETAQLVGDFRRAHRDAPQLDRGAPQNPDFVLQRSTDFVVGHPMPLPTARSIASIA